MKKLLSLLLMVLMLLGGAAFAEENEEDTTPVVAPIVTFKSGFYVGYLDREIKITVSCKNKNSATVPEKYLELRNHRGEVLERAFWRNPRYDLTFSVYVTEDMLGGNKLSVWLDGVKGTFYVTGDFVRRNPERIQRIIDAGHELGSHGNNLINMTEVSYARVQENIRELNDLCEETFGVRPRLFCAHLGATNSIVTAIARAEGVEDCLFAIDACDWSDAYKDKVYQMVYRVTSDRVTSGCVVQFHINGYHTAEVLDKALDNWINVKGLRPVTVGELMQLSGRDFPPLPDYD
ncbi:MAG: polysaccharide deacetylase family protein [Christensenellales bacterium]